MPHDQLISSVIIRTPQNDRQSFFFPISISVCCFEKYSRELHVHV